MVSRWYWAHHPAAVPVSCLGQPTAPVPTILPLKEPPMNYQSMAHLSHSSFMMGHRAGGKNVESNSRNQTSLRDAHQP